MKRFRSYSRCLPPAFPNRLALMLILLAGTALADPADDLAVDPPQRLELAPASSSRDTTQLTLRAPAQHGGFGGYLPVNVINGVVMIAGNGNNEKVFIAMAAFIAWGRFIDYPL